MQVNLDDITDVKELKAMKSDQYDILETSQKQIRVAEHNIKSLNARLAQLQESQSIMSQAQEQAEKLNEQIAAEEQTDAEQQA